MVDEQVVLVNEADQELGTMVKSGVHNDKTPLHRAFSLFIFDDHGRVLVQQRGLNKKTWPGIWSNSCCGHPVPGESYEAAIKRRVRQELGLELLDLTKVADYRYRFERNGVVENELCPVYRARTTGEVQANREEIEDWKWMDWNEWLEVLKNDQQEAWSPWCKEEVLLLDPRGGVK